MRPRSWRRLARWAVLAAGFAFLYAPIAHVILFSFNASSSTASWAGFSGKWYAVLLDNDGLLRAARLSLEIAVLSASGATLIGTIVGYVMARFGSFRGRALLSSMASAPLVMPEIVMGVSLLLLFISLEDWLGWPNGRGVLTIALAHIIMTTAFVAIVVQARLAGLDRSVEEAALDLGATPFTVVRLITIPLIFPAIAAGWLLCFSLSLDNVVVSLFTSGPGSTTLPLLIFSLVRRGVKPDVNAMATIFVLFAIVVTVSLARLQRWRSRDDDADGR
ncbi:MAG TPA: ABC transporter permease subunit [Candidatus Angelobacter sp.]|nr:ABC transporter permease subunit [Candidatus Angelobacter sp.]